MRVAYEGITRDSGTLTVFLLGLRVVPVHAEAIILTAHPDLIRALDQTEEWGSAGVAKLGNSHLLHPILSELQNCAPIKLQQWGPTTDKGMISVTKALVKKVLIHDGRFTAQEVQLVAGSQKVFYKALTWSNIYRSVEPQTAIRIKVALTQFALNGSTPTSAEIWKGIRHTKNIRNFLWKVLHNSFTIGDHWSNIPNFGHQQHCRLCDETEMVRHILFKCGNSPSQKTIWSLAEKLWHPRKTS